jgi:hypothetical protein
MSHVGVVGRNQDLASIVRQMETMWAARIRDVVVHTGPHGSDYSIYTDGTYPVPVGDKWVYRFTKPSRTYAAIKTLQGRGFHVYLYAQPKCWHQLAGDGYGKRMIEWFKPLQMRMPGLGVYFDGLATHRYMGWWEIVGNPYWQTVPNILHGSAEAAEGGRAYWDGFAQAVMIGETALVGSDAEDLVRYYAPRMTTFLHPNILGGGNNWPAQAWPHSLVVSLAQSNGGLVIHESEIAWLREHVK